MQANITFVKSESATPTNAAASSSTGESTPFTRLGALAPLGLRAANCLHLQKNWVGCRRCADACPHACLQTVEAGIELDATACTGCGQCAAACPTDALAVDGFALQQDCQRAGPNERELRIGCQRQGAEAALRVPCLGGVGEFDLMLLLARRLADSIALVDDGSCAACANRRSDALPPPQRLACDAGETLQRFAGSCGDRVRVVHSLPTGNNTSTGSGSTAPRAPRAGRRAFFSGLGRALSSGVARQAGALRAVDLASLPRQPRTAVRYTRGHETRLLSTQLAERQAPAAARLARVSVSDACRAHGACTRLCPTAALQLVEADGIRQLRFDAWLCIDCAACAKACPEKALQHEAAAWREFGDSPVVLSERRSVTCGRCGADFTDIKDDGEPLCAVCHKTAALSQAGFSLFGGLRRPQPAAPP